jgi:hypothetical protein
MEHEQKSRAYFLAMLVTMSVDMFNGTPQVVSPDLEPLNAV